MGSWNKKLTTAARDGDIEALKLCLQNGADIDYRDGYGWTALMFAAWDGHLEICRLLIDTGCKIDTTSGRGWTALMWAAQGGQLEVCRLLIDTGCKIDITSINGETALHWAAEWGHLQTTRCLVEQGGASPLIKTRQGKTPYDLAAKKKKGQYKEVMEYLQTVMSEKSSGVTAGQGIEDPIHTQTKSTMLNRLLGSGTYVSYDMRCMVTGQFAVGKSSLVKLLAGNVVPEGRHPTDGISLLEGRCGLDVETRSWIHIDPETYDALDVVYNKVLMTSVEEDERKEEKTPKKPHLPDSNPVRSDSKVMTAGPSQQPLAAKPLSPQISDSKSKRIPELKTHMKSKMTKEEIRKRMENVLKSGNYKMKVGRLIFWDFGGQYVYYTTHQTFMTFRALFLVVFDGSKGLHELVPDVLCFPGQHMTPTPAVFLQHWVNSILTYCKVVYVGIPKILFVATHKDKIPVDDVESRREELYNGVEELFKDHEGRNHLVLTQRIFVNARDNTDTEIEVLKTAITELTFEHPCWGEKMPNACVPLELEIAELVAEGKQILSLKDVEELNAISNVSVLSPDQLKDFLNFHHSLGKIVYFDTPQLKDFVIINPLLMVEVMRSFVTDKVFWPEETRIQETFKRMSTCGTIRREDLYLIWEQKDFSAILPYKEFIFNILIYLDILAEQRRYDTTTGSRLPVENFFVPCMVTERNTTSFMDKECTAERAICLAFLFKGTIIPPALPNRLISACLSMWTLKQYQGRKLLFSGFIGLSFDKSHDIVVCVEGNKILLYIVHRTSSGLIVPDIATGVKECLVTTMGRISDFYQSTIHAKRSKQSPFHIEYSCSKLHCFISEEEALQTSKWVCDEHKLTHRAGDWLVWNQDQQKEQCEEKCQGLSDDALSQIPSDNELLRLSIHCASSKMHSFVTYLGMLQKWEDITYNYPDNIEVSKFLVLSKWKEQNVKGCFKVLAEALNQMEISSHLLCQVRRVRKSETDIPADYLDFIPTDEILDKLAPQIGQVFFQLGVEFGLSVSILENIKNKNPRDLAAQNREVLFAWREDRSVKPTIRVLIQALVNIGKGARCLKEVLENVDPSTLKASEVMENIDPSTLKASEVMENIDPSPLKASEVMENVDPSTLKASEVMENIDPSTLKASEVMENIDPSTLKASEVMENVDPSTLKASEVMESIDPSTLKASEVMENIDPSTLKASEVMVHKSTGAIPKLLAVKHFSATTKSDKQTPRQRNLKRPSRIPVAVMENIDPSTLKASEVMENIDPSTLKALEVMVHKSTGAIPKLITVKHFSATTKSDKQTPRQRNLKRPSRIPVAVKQVALTAQRKPRPTDPPPKGKRSDKS
ncbi:uncharacterized protein LOC143055150 [Mytilus galloprovincialis]|uniref:uncharacterized protein LOC143055150 n=1 Tax=Mytilus galloprovincialis TaxID=29158 RepID=UPI003F7C097A